MLLNILSLSYQGGTVGIQATECIEIIRYVYLNVHIIEIGDGKNGFSKGLFKFLFIISSTNGE